MVFGNCNEIKMTLNECSTVKELEEFAGSVQIPKKLIRFYFERFVELSLQDIEFEVSKSVLRLIRLWIHSFISLPFFWSNVVCYPFSSPQTIQLKKLFRTSRWFTIHL